MVLFAIIKQELAFAVIDFARAKVDSNKIWWHVFIVLILLVFLFWLVIVVHLLIKLRALILEAKRLISLSINQGKL